jgi:tetratricopeptide (TPR) repeat protein
MPGIRYALTSLSDNDPESIEATVASRDESLPYLVAIGLELYRSRPRLAMHIFATLARRPAPTNPEDHQAWLRAHNNACAAAVWMGKPEEQRDIVERALVHAPVNPAIYHNAACILCKLGETEPALELVREAVARLDDPAAIQAMADDPDLDPIRHTDAFRAAIAGHAEFEPPSWAEGWTAWEFIQFREFVGSTLDGCDMTRFEAGRVVYEGRELDVIELARRCRERSHAEWGQIVNRYFVEQLGL